MQRGPTVEFFVWESPCRFRSTYLVNFLFLYQQTMFNSNTLFTVVKKEECCLGKCALILIDGCCSPNQNTALNIVKWNTLLVTARIRSLWEGNVFTHVCLSVSLSVQLYPGGSHVTFPMIHWGSSI